MWDNYAVTLNIYLSQKYDRFMKTPFSSFDNQALDAGHTGKGGASNGKGKDIKRERGNNRE